MTSAAIFRTTLLAVSLIFMAGNVSAQENSRWLIIDHPTEDDIPIEILGNVGIDAATGNVRATRVDAQPEACTLSGDGDGGCPTCECDGVQVDIQSFTVNNATSTTVAQGNSLTFRWQSRGAWSCSGSELAGWTGSNKAPSNSSGQVVSTADLSVGEHEATLTCENGANDTRTVTINVTEGNGGSPENPNCEGRTLGSNWTRLTTGGLSCRHSTFGDGHPHGWIATADCSFFEGVFPWPFSNLETGSQRVLGTRPGHNGGRQYVAMQFNTGNLPASHTGQLSVNIPQVHGWENRNKHLTISTCPGDFNKQSIDSEMGPGCYRQTFTDNMNWGGSDHVSAVGRCGLEPNKTYYLNFIHTQQTPGTPISEIQPHPDCVDNTCGFRLTPY